MTLAEVCSETFKHLTYNINKQVEEWFFNVAAEHGFIGEYTVENLKQQGFKGMCEKQQFCTGYDEVTYKVYKNDELIGSYAIKINY